MKKALLLTLIVLSCLAFASCDIVSQFVPGLDLGGGIGNKVDITEEEWLELVSETNYSSNYTYYENQDGELAATVNFERKYDNTTSYEKRIENGEISYEEYITVMDNKGYSIYDNNNSDGFVLHPLDSIPEPTPLMSETNAKECYQYLKETDDNTYTIKYKSSDAYTLEYVIELQDGKIVSMTETYTHKNGDDKMETKFFDIGTTVIEIPEYSNGDNGGAEEVRTTITEEEWIEAMSLRNFSCTGKGNQFPLEMTYKLTETIEYQHMFLDSSNPDVYTDSHFYYTMIDGVSYKISSDLGEPFVAKEESHNFSTYLGSLLVENPIAVYNKLAYDEETKSYKYERTVDDSTEVYIIGFENGKIVKFDFKSDDVLKSSFSCFDFGTTVIELPEFTYADDTEEVRTTITEEEWAEFCELSNFSYTVNAGDVQTTIKMTESAYHVQQNEHYEIVVSIDDVLYTLHPYEEDSYFAYEYTKPSPLSNIGNMLPVSYDALVYDAETKSYAAQGENETFVFYFENGKIVAGEIVMPAPDGSEVKGILYDFGTTVLNFDNVLLPNQ